MYEYTSTCIFEDILHFDSTCAVCAHANTVWPKNVFQWAIMGQIGSTIVHARTENILILHRKAQIASLEHVALLM